MQDVREVMHDVREVMQDVREVMQDVREVMQDVREVMQDVRGITHDVRVMQDVKEVMQDAREGMQDVSEITQDVSRVVHSARDVVREDIPHAREVTCPSCSRASKLQARAPLWSASEITSSPLYCPVGICHVLTHVPPVTMVSSRHASDQTLSETFQRVTGVCAGSEACAPLVLLLTDVSRSSASIFCRRTFSRTVCLSRS